MLSTVITQVALNGLDDTEDFYKSEFSSWERARKIRWTGVDVSKTYKALGFDLEGNKKVFSLAGHFVDPLKLQDPSKLIKGKASPIMRAIADLRTQSDWAERPFTGMKEFAKTGKTIKGSSYAKKEQFFNQLPSWAVNQIIGMQPIQMGYLLRYLMGEEDGLTAALSSAGMHISTSYRPRTKKGLKRKL